MTKYRVTYPLFSTDGHRDFDTRAEADAFANEKRNNPGRYQTFNAWRMVEVKEISE